MKAAIGSPLSWLKDQATGLMDTGTKMMGQRVVDSAKGLATDRQFGTDMASKVVGDPDFKDGLVNTVGKNLRGKINDIPFGIGGLFLDQQAPGQQQSPAQQPG